MQYLTLCAGILEIAAAPAPVVFARSRCAGTLRSVVDRSSAFSDE